jgi:hypothetical protein
MLAPNPLKPARSPAAGPPPGAGLSNDYLNHYSEVLMLIEAAGEDPELAHELRQWQPVDYRSYFTASPLRRAQAALDAYEALPVERRFVFEKLVRAMDQLAEMTILAIGLKDDPDTAVFVPSVAAPILRRLIARAAHFLNSGGEDIDRCGALEDAQDAIDWLLSCVIATDEAA